MKHKIVNLALAALVGVSAAVTSSVPVFAQSVSVASNLVIDIQYRDDGFDDDWGRGPPPPFFEGGRPVRPDYDRPPPPPPPYFEGGRPIRPGYGAPPPRFAGRGRCEGWLAEDKARDFGLRRAQVVDVTPRRVVVEGFRRGGRLVTMSFANVRGCPPLF